MIECLNCEHTSHSGFGAPEDMKCPHCGGRRLADDENVGFDGD